MFHFKLDQQAYDYDSTPTCMQLCAGLPSNHTYSHIAQQFVRCPPSLCQACIGLQVETGDPICWLSSANLMEVAPTFHIARFLPSILDSKAPFTFALQVCQPLLPSRVLWPLLAQG